MERAPKWTSKGYGPPATHHPPPPPHYSSYCIISFNPLQTYKLKATLETFLQRTLSYHEFHFSVVFASFQIWRSITLLDYFLKCIILILISGIMRCCTKKQVVCDPYPSFSVAPCLSISGKVRERGLRTRARDPSTIIAHFKIQT